MGLGGAGPFDGQAPTDSALAEAVAGWFVRVVALLVVAGGLFAAGVGVALLAPVPVVVGLLVAAGGGVLLRRSWRQRSSESAATHGRPPAG